MSGHTPREYDYWQAKFEQSQSEAQHENEVRKLVTQIHEAQIKVLELQNEHFSVACQREHEAISFQRSVHILKFRLDLIHLIKNKDYDGRVVGFILADQANLLGLDIDQEIEAIKALKDERGEK